MKNKLSYVALALMFSSMTMASEYTYRLNSNDGEMVAEFATEDEFYTTELELKCHQRLQAGLERNEFESASCDFNQVDQRVPPSRPGKEPGRGPGRDPRPTPPPPSRPTNPGKYPPNPGKYPTPPHYPAPSRPTPPPPRPPHYPNPGRPTPPPPRPPIMVTEVCTVQRVDRITGIYVSQTYREVGTGYDYWSARNAACAYALNRCERDTKIHQMCVIR